MLIRLLDLSFVYRGIRWHTETQCMPIYRSAVRYLQQVRPESFCAPPLIVRSMSVVCDHSLMVKRPPSKWDTASPSLAGCSMFDSNTYPNCTHLQYNTGDQIWLSAEGNRVIALLSHDGVYWQEGISRSLNKLRGFLLFRHRALVHLRKLKSWL